ncbi:hypothetical protein H4R20_001812 [Coemansia guatemalensis]|uniref:SART-1 protein n=1 Tax=Coemansia guatemalensis TaxID=2761395 RepID=A0A9W8HYU6_9FUNG|nr:hypothetical protein H4R20_001812 [Coemansia guatemalensis]
MRLRNRKETSDDEGKVEQEKVDKQPLSTLEWIERSRQRQREQHSQSPPPQSEKSKKRAEYTASDLAGMRVAYGVDGIAEGGEQILTLQDQTIDELATDNVEEGLQLESIAARDAEKARKNSERRKRKYHMAGVDTVYDALDDEDEESKRPVHTIKAGGLVHLDDSEEREQGKVRECLGKHKAETFDSVAPQAIDDYYTTEEAAKLFRKSQKKAKKEKRARNRNGKKSTTNDLLTDVADIDSDRVNAILSRSTRIDDSKFADEDDDDDLQKAIASVRKAARARTAQPRDNNAPGVLENQALSAAKDTAKQPEPTAAEDEQAEDPELVLSSTIEFVQSLKASAAASAVVSATRPINAPLPDSVAAEEEGGSGDQLEAEEETPVIVKGLHQSQSTDTPHQGARKGLVSSTRPATARQAQPQSTEQPATSDTVFFAKEEPSVGTGLAATLNLLRQRNMLESLTDEQREREQQQRSRDQWIAKHREQEAALQLERQRIKQLGKRQPAENVSGENGAGKKGRRRGKADEMTQQELEGLKAHEQELLDRKWAREYEERMRDYKPEVKLEYVDETGRQLSTKEAYKQLSHAFHGHYSGKNKIDKLMKKRDQERRQMELTASDVTHRHGQALENSHRKLGTAGIIFSSSDAAANGSKRN